MFCLKASLPSIPIVCVRLASFYSSFLRHMTKPEEDDRGILQKPQLTFRMARQTYCLMESCCQMSSTQFRQGQLLHLLRYSQNAERVNFAIIYEECEYTAKFEPRTHSLYLALSKFLFLSSRRRLAS